MDSHVALLSDFTIYDNYVATCKRLGFSPVTWFEFCRAKENRLATAVATSAPIALNAAAVERNIPEPLRFEELGQDLRSKFHLAGTHGAYRDSSEAAQAFYADIPEPIIRSGSESILEAFLDGKHYAHIVPHSSGGGYEPLNMVWTPAHDNLSQGIVPLSPYQVSLYELRNNQEALSLSRELDRIDLLADTATIGSVVAAAAVTGGLSAVTQRIAYLYGLGGSQALKTIPQMTELIAADVTYAAINSSIRGSSSVGISMLTGNPALGAAIGFVIVDGLDVLGKAVNNQLSASDATEFAVKALGSGALVATCVALPPVGLSMALLNVLGSFVRGFSESGQARKADSF